MSIEITPMAYKFKVKREGIINEFVTIKDIPVKEAEEKIKDFLEYFKIVAIRKEIKNIDETEKENEKKEYSTSQDRMVYIVEFMKNFPEFVKHDYVDFMISKNLKFKSIARANDDFNALKEKGFLKRILPHKWQFICSEEDLKSFLKDKGQSTKKEQILVQEINLDQDKRLELMYKNMAGREYFTMRDWLDFMMTPPNNYDDNRIKNNFYHDIANLGERVTEIKMDGISYKPKRYKIIKDEDIKGKEGQKILLQ